MENKSEPLAELVSLLDSLIHPLLRNVMKGNFKDSILPDYGSRYKCKMNNFNELQRIMNRMLKMNNSQNKKAIAYIDLLNYQMMYESLYCLTIGFGEKLTQRN